MPATYPLTNPVWTAALATAGLLQPYFLDPGSLVQIVSGVTAAGSALTPQTPAFTIPMRPDGATRTLEVSALGAGAVPTTVSVQLLSSSDNGATWQNEGSALAVVATSVPAPQQITVSSGRIYAMVVSSLTLGSATSVTVLATLT